MRETFHLKDVTCRGILEIPELVIPANSFFWVSGPSGSGKTTLLKLLNNLVSPDRGRVIYRGRDIFNLDPVDLRRRVIMVSQAPFIFPGSVLDNIRLAFNFSLKKIPAQEKLEEMLTSFNLPPALEKGTANLSGGEKQRLALVRALLLEPEALLLDEPTAALDEENSLTVFECLKNWLGEKERTVVMVSHAANLAACYSDRAVALLQGRLVSPPVERGGPP